MTLLWALRYFARSVPRRRSSLVGVLDRAAQFAFFWIPFFDRLIQHHPGAYDGASGLYFRGIKAAHTLTEEELLASYRGAFARVVNR